MTPTSLVAFLVAGGCIWIARQPRTLPHTHTKHHLDITHGQASITTPRQQPSGLQKCCTRVTQRITHIYHTENTARIQHPIVGQLCLLLHLVNKAQATHTVCSWQARTGP